MKALLRNATAAVTLALCIGLPAAARDAPPTYPQESATGGEVPSTAFGPGISSAGVENQIADAKSVRPSSEGGLAGPPWTTQKVAKSLQKSLEGHLMCADWAVVMAGLGGGTDVTTSGVNKGYNFWNSGILLYTQVFLTTCTSAGGQPVDDYDYICRSIVSVPPIAAGMNQRPVLYAANDAMLGALFWRKKGNKPKLSADEVREMVLAAADKCAVGDDFMACTFDDILATGEAPLAGVYAMWPPASVGFALSDPTEIGLVQIPYVYRLPKKPTPMIFIVQAM